MNLSTIPVTPHALGFIKVACDDDPMFGESRTRNEFLITERHHQPGASSSDGKLPPKLAPHPLQAKLAAAQADGETQAVKEIPIRLYFNRVENAISIRYQAYRTPGNMPVCSGDGKNAKRLVLAADNTATLQDVSCPAPERCPLVSSGEAACRRQVRMPVQIEGQNDPLSVFEVRTSSLNTYRALKAQLQLIGKRFGGLRHVPLKLTLWQASNEASSYEPFSLMRLVLDAPTEREAMQKTKESRDELIAAGIQDDTDAIVAEEEGVDGAFEGGALDFQAVSEFYHPTGRRQGTEAVTPHTVASVRGRTASGLAGVANAAIEEAVRRSSESQQSAAAVAAA